VERDTSLAPFSAISRPSTGDKKFLLVKGISGLGNRILSALNGILYAGLSERKLVVDWSDPVYSSDGSNVFHRFFTSVSCSPVDGIPMTDSVYPAIWRDRLHESARRLAEEHAYNPAAVRRELSINLSNLDYQEDLVILVEYHARMELLRPHFRPAEDLAQMSDAAVLVKLLKDDFILRPEIRSRVDQFKSNHFHSRTVGVHVRYSDHRTRIFAIVKQLNALLERERDLQIFLATDNLEILKMFERNYSGVIATPHWYGLPGSAIHNNPASPSRIETAIEALIDLYLLAECDHLIIDSSSSFSYVAGLLSSAPIHNKINVAIGAKGNRRIRNTTTRYLRWIKFSSWGFRLLPKLVRIRKL
jgi:hypothetical protein